MSLRPSTTYEEHAPSFKHLLLDMQHHQMSKLFVTCRLMHQSGFHDITSKLICSEAMVLCLLLLDMRLARSISEVNQCQVCTEQWFYQTS